MIESRSIRCGVTSLQQQQQQPLLQQNLSNTLLRRPVRCRPRLPTSALPPIRPTLPGICPTTPPASIFDFAAGSNSHRRQEQGGHLRSSSSMSASLPDFGDLVIESYRLTPGEMRTRPQPPQQQHATDDLGGGQSPCQPPEPPLMSATADEVGGTRSDDGAKTMDGASESLVARGRGDVETGDKEMQKDVNIEAV